MALSEYTHTGALGRSNVWLERLAAGSCGLLIKWSSVMGMHTSAPEGVNGWLED